MLLIGKALQDTTLKIKESRYIALLVVSGSIKKLFSIDYVKFIYSQYFFQSILPGGKALSYPKLLISRFSNFNIKPETSFAMYENLEFDIKHFLKNNKPKSR